MDTQQAYIKGFVKRASAYGFNEYQAVELLKQAVSLGSAMSGLKVLKNSGAVQNAAKWGGRALTAAGVFGYGSKALDTMKDRWPTDKPGALLGGVINTADAVGMAHPAIGKVISGPNRYLKTIQNNRDQVRGFEAGKSTLAQALGKERHDAVPQNPQMQDIQSILGGAPTPQANSPQYSPTINRMAAPSSRTVAPNVQQPTPNNTISTLPTNIPNQPGYPLMAQNNS